MITERGNEYYFRVVEQVTGNEICELPRAAFGSCSWVNNNYGRLQINQKTTDLGAADLARLHEVEVQMWRNEDLVWWGIPISDGGGPGVQSISCDGLFAYFEDRIVADQTLEWFDVDQFTIVADLVTYAQNEATQANRNWGILPYIVTPSGKNRTQRYERADHKVIADLIREFPTLSDGFDFDVEFTPDGQKRFVPYYPARGRVVDDVMLEYGKNVTNYSINRTAVDLGTETYATGGSVPNSATGKMEQVYEDLAASAKYKVVQRVISEGSQMDPVWLLEKATKDVEVHKKPLGNPSITAVEVQDAQLWGVVELGDWVPVRIVDGYRTVESMFRVNSITLNPDETLNYTFEDEAEAA